MTTLVTGGAGYIGSHVVSALARDGRDIVVADTLRTGNIEAVPQGVQLEIADVRDHSAISRILRTYPIESCIHLAGLKNPGESMRIPDEYMSVNLLGTHVLASALVSSGVENIVFSSSCAVYGNASDLPVNETSQALPASPYGSSKLAAEEVFRGYSTAGRIRNINLRYFNAAGADPSGTIGENWDDTSNLIPLLCKAMLGQRPPVVIFGNDYPTPDGTALRDYVHVSDLADAHLLALKHLEAGNASDTLNLGTGVASSVMEIIDKLQTVSGLLVPWELGARRAGDPAAVWADPGRAAASIGWLPHNDLDAIVETAWRWHSKSVN